MGLALSGGAARGIAHVGVFRVLREHGIPVDCVAGTSAGALAGGALAAGMSLAEIESFARRLRWRNLAGITLSPRGLQSSARVEEYIRESFPLTRFEDLLTPFAAVATDLHTGSPVVISGRGDVAFAIRASCALPGWYVPVVDEQGRHLVDGGLVANVPVAAARSLGADVVLAVDVNADGAKFLQPSQSLVGVLLESLLIVQRTASAQQRQAADLVILPRVGHIRWDEMGRADELIAAGEEATREALEQIKRLIEPRPDSYETPLPLRQPDPQTV